MGPFFHQRKIQSCRFGPGGQWGCFCSFVCNKVLEMALLPTQMERADLGLWHKLSLGGGCLLFSIPSAASPPFCTIANTHCWRLSWPYFRGTHMLRAPQPPSLQARRWICFSWAVPRPCGWAAFGHQATRPRRPRPGRAGRGGCRHLLSAEARERPAHPSSAGAKCFPPTTGLPSSPTWSPHCISLAGLVAKSLGLWHVAGPPWTSLGRGPKEAWEAQFLVLWALMEGGAPFHSLRHWSARPGCQLVAREARLTFPSMTAQ